MKRNLMYLLIVFAGLLWIFLTPADRKDDIVANIPFLVALWGLLCSLILTDKEE